MAEGMNFCPGCGTAVSTGPISCPKCGSRIGPDMRFCGQCGQPRMKERRITSTSSGPSRVESHSRQAVPVGQAAKQPKNESIGLILAIVLGFLGIWGMGHIYVGRVQRGLVLFFIGLLISTVEIVLLIELMRNTFFGYVYRGEFLAGVVVLGLLDFILWIWQIFDARQVCRTYNQTL